MSFEIIDTEGATVASFVEASDARAFLRKSVRDDASSRDELAVIRYDDGGNPVGEPLLVSEFLIPANVVVRSVLRALAMRGSMTTVDLADYVTVSISEKTLALALERVAADQTYVDSHEFEMFVSRDRRVLTPG